MDENTLTAVLWAWIAYWTGAVAKNKGYAFHVGFAWGSVFSILALIIFALLPHRIMEPATPDGLNNLINSRDELVKEINKVLAERNDANDFTDMP